MERERKRRKGKERETKKQRSKNKQRWRRMKISREVREGGLRGRKREKLSERERKAYGITYFIGEWGGIKIQRER